ncbi:Uncharacterised protein [Escherichia coli]|nr:Uncharacterised protein [Escherichia coli]
MHNGVLGVNIGHWQLHNGKQFGCRRIFSVQALLATICMVLTGKP